MGITIAIMSVIIFMFVPIVYKCKAAATVPAQLRGNHLSYQRKMQFQAKLVCFFHRYNEIFSDMQMKTVGLTVFGTFVFYIVPLFVLGSLIYAQLDIATEVGLVKTINLYYYVLVLVLPDFSPHLLSIRK